MAVPFFEFDVPRGDDKTYQITVTDAAGAPVDLTGLTGDAIKFVARRHPRAPVFLSKNIGGGISITNAVGGICQVALADTDTSGLGNYEQVFGWDVQVTIGSTTSTVAEGTLTVKPDYVY